jgi:TolB-like protein
MKKTAIQILPELVRKQLQQILQINDLKRSPMLAKFLQFVVVSKLEGKEDEIKEYTIGVKALGRPVDFNPQLDAVVRIHASRLRNILFKYYHGIGKDDLIFIDIPKGAYVPVFEKNMDKAEVLRHFVNSQTEINSYERPSPLKPNLLPSKPVLAVLPFHDLSPESSNKNFLTSLAEQLSTELARFDNISIISYYATQNFNPAVKDLKELGREIGIDYVLTGSLRLLNETLRLNIQLMMVDTGNVLWSDSFQRNQLTDQNAMDIQDEIISQIANVVADDHGMVGKLNKLKPWKNSEESNVVHDAIIQYFEFTYNYDSRKFETTVKVIENAYKVCDDNALITGILAKLYLDQYACSGETTPELFEKGMELANKAVALDARSQHAQKALAWALVLSGQKEKSVVAIDRCIALNPTAASNLGTMGLGLIMQGEYENGFSMLSQALQLTQNPSACIKLGLAIFYFRGESYDESKKWLDRLSPFEFPFASLLYLAVQGKTNGKVLSPRQDSISNIVGREKDILERIVRDPALIEEIIEGLNKAGYSPNFGTVYQLSA